LGGTILALKTTCVKNSSKAGEITVRKPDFLQIY